MSEVTSHARGNIYVYVAIAILLSVIIGSVGAYYVIQDKPTEEFGNAKTDIKETKKGVKITATELSGGKLVIVTPNDVHTLPRVGESVTLKLLQRDQFHIFIENSFGRRTLHKSYVIQKPSTSRLAARQARPSAWNNTTFVATKHYITRLSQHGNERWRYLHPEFEGEPTFPDKGCYEEDYLYGCQWMDTTINKPNDVFGVTHEPGEVIAINKFGKNRWNHTYDSYERLTAIEAYNNQVFVGHTGADSVAISWLPQRTGEWNPDNIKRFNPPTQDEGTTVTVTDIQKGPQDSLYFSTRHGDDGQDANSTMYRWSPSEGTVWEQSIQTSKSSGSRFMYANPDGGVYVGLDDRLIRLNPKTGDVMWSQPLEKPPNSMAVSGSSIFLSHEDRNIRRIDKQTGVPTPNPVWPAGFGSSQTRVLANCGATGGDSGFFVMPGSEDTIQIIRPNSSIVWSHQTADSTFFAGCSIANK